MDMKRIAVIILVGFMASGCAKVSRLPQLLTLKGMSDNRDLQKKQVTRERADFEKAVAAYKDNTLGNYSDKKSVLRNIGAPLIVRETVRNGQPVERWLYRDPLKSFESGKVYLYFDEAGKLAEWEYVQPKPKTPPAPDADPQT